MDIDLIFKIAAIGIIVAVLNQLLIRSGREDRAMMTTLAGLVVVLSILVKQISVLLSPSSPSFALASALTMLGLMGDGGCAAPCSEKAPWLSGCLSQWEPLSLCCGKSARQRRPCH